MRSPQTPTRRQSCGLLGFPTAGSKAGTPSCRRPISRQGLRTGKWERREGLASEEVAGDVGPASPVLEDVGCRGRAGKAPGGTKGEGGERLPVARGTAVIT